MAAISDADIRHYARIALGDFGVGRGRLTQIASHHNDVFRVDTRRGQRFVLRLQNDRMSDTRARSQIEWLEYLSQNCDVPAPQPVRTEDERPFTHVRCRSGLRRAVLLRWVPGRKPRSRGDSFWIPAAEMIAKLHIAAEAFGGMRGFSCRVLDAESLFGADYFLRHRLAARHLKKRQVTIARRAEAFVCDGMARLGRSRRRFGIIHADVNRANLVLHEGKLGVIDFDELSKGHFLFDLAELIRTSLRPGDWERRKEPVVVGYSKARKLAPVELDCFDAMIVATHVQYLNWAFMHAKRVEEDLKWVGFTSEIVGEILKVHGGV